MLNVQKDRICYINILYSISCINNLRNLHSLILIDYKEKNKHTYFSIPFLEDILNVRCDFKLFSNFHLYFYSF